MRKKKAGEAKEGLLQVTRGQDGRRSATVHPPQLQVDFQGQGRTGWDGGLHRRPGLSRAGTLNPQPDRSPAEQELASSSASPRGSPQVMHAQARVASVSA